MIFVTRLYKLKQTYNEYFYLGARKTQDDRVEYLVEFKDEWPNRVVSAVDAIEKLPNLLLQFLESHITMYSGQRRVTFATIDETLNLPGEPIRVTCKY